MTFTWKDAIKFLLGAILGIVFQSFVPAWNKFGQEVGMQFCSSVDFACQRNLSIVVIAVFIGLVYLVNAIGDKVTIRLRRHIVFLTPSLSWQPKSLYLIVSNTGRNRINNCFAVIDEMFFLYPSDNYPSRIIRRSPVLRWEDVPSSDGRIAIDGKRDVRLSLIEVNGDHFSITYHANISEESFSAQRGLPDGKYEMKVSLYGDINDKTELLYSEVYIVELVIDENEMRLMMRTKAQTPEKEYLFVERVHTR